MSALEAPIARHPALQAARTLTGCVTLLAVLVATTGCERLLDARRGLASTSAPAVIESPELVTVRQGDTLASLAVRHGVTAEQIRSWNGLPSDEIEADQVLLVWPKPKPTPAQIARASGQNSLRSVLASALGEPAAQEPASQRPTPGSAPRKPPPAPSVAAMQPAEQPAVQPITAPAGSAEPLPAEPPSLPPGQKIAIQRPALASMLGTDVGSGIDLAAATEGLTQQGSSVGGSNSLGERSLGTGGTADTLQMQRPEMINLGPQIPDTPVSPPRLTKPPPKTCLRSGSTVIAEDGAVAASGLSVSQISAGMSQISRYTVRCFPPGTAGSYEVIVEMTVACDGRVSNVFLINGGAVPARVTSCVTQTLGAASGPPAVG